MYIYNYNRNIQESGHMICVLWSTDLGLRMILQGLYFQICIISFYIIQVCCLSLSYPTSA